MFYHFSEGVYVVPGSWLVDFTYSPPSLTAYYLEKKE
jgi:hypothetical protein